VHLSLSNRAISVQYNNLVHCVGLEYGILSKTSQISESYQKQPATPLYDGGASFFTYPCLLARPIRHEDQLALLSSNEGLIQAIALLDALPSSKGN